MWRLIVLVDLMLVGFAKIIRPHKIYLHTNPITYNIVEAHYSQNFIILALDNKAVMVAIFETIVDYRLCYFALKHILWVLIGIASARLFQ